MYCLCGCILEGKEGRVDGRTSLHGKTMSSLRDMKQLEYFFDMKGLNDYTRPSGKKNYVKNLINPLCGGR